MKLVTFAIFVALFCNNLSLYAITLEWTRELETPEYDLSYSVSADGLGNVYITGLTYGNLGGTNSGLSDAFVSKYDQSGDLLWTEQLGSTEHETSYGVSADGLGNIYITGTTDGILGETNSGLSDAFVSKYDQHGSLLWTEQLGTTEHEASYDVSADGLGNIYITGSTRGNLVGTNAGSNDSFVSKYDHSGNLLWTEQLGSSDHDISQGVSADSLGNVFISGRTSGSLDGINDAGPYSDAFVSKYDQSGNLQWTKQLGSSTTDESNAVSADGLGNVYITGRTNGTLGGTNHGSYDAFVSKYNQSGDLLWTEQLGSSTTESSYGVSTDGLGNVYIAGVSAGNLDGSDDELDSVFRSFLSKFDQHGNLLWTEQLRTLSSHNISYGVSADGYGSVYITGRHDAVSCVSDAYIAKYSETIPEPCTALTTGLAFLATTLLRPRRS